MKGQGAGCAPPSHEICGGVPLVKVRRRDGRTLCTAQSSRQDMPAIRRSRQGVWCRVSGSGSHSTGTLEAEATVQVHEKWRPQSGAGQSGSRSHNSGRGHAGSGSHNSGMYMSDWNWKPQSRYRPDRTQKPQFWCTGSGSHIQVLNRLEAETTAQMQARVEAKATTQVSAD